MVGVYNDVLELIGNTPMIRLNKITKNYLGEFYAKVESFNPGHSTKDRIALYIIEKAEKDGLIKPGGTIVETTSGNTGFSVAMVSIIKGYKCILAVSDKTKLEKISFLKALGAKIHVCPSDVASDDPRSYYETAKKIANETPGSLYINQYFNELNIEAHYNTTGAEIWEQTQGKITHLIACVGTGGTISGSAKFLKEKNPNIKIIGVDAEGSVNDEQSAYTTKEIALKEGLMVGYTSGAAMQALKQISTEFTKDSFVVIIFPDHGSRYMSKVFSDDWMNEQ
ncbi:unnamed protein product, partial [Darwinula stevensoni]